MTGKQNRKWRNPVLSAVRLLDRIMKYMKGIYYQNLSIMCLYTGMHWIHLQTLYLVYKQNVSYEFTSASLFEKHSTLKFVWQ